MRTPPAYLAVYCAAACTAAAQTVLPATPGKPGKPFVAELMAALQARPLPERLAFHSAVFRFPVGPSATKCIVAFDVPLDRFKGIPEAGTAAMRFHASFLAVVRNAQGEIVAQADADGSYEMQDPNPDLLRTEMLTASRQFELQPGSYTVETAALDPESMNVGAKRAALNIPAHPVTGVSDIAVVRRVEPPDAAGIGADPFQMPGGHVVPSLTGDLDGKSGGDARLFFVIYPDAGNSEPIRLDIQFAADGETVLSQGTDLPAQPAPLPYLARLPTESLAAGGYEAIVTVRQGKAGERRRVPVQCPLCSTPAKATAAPPAETPAAQPGEPLAQAGLIDRIRDYTVSYDKQLPNFFCVEEVRRYFDPFDPRVMTPRWRLIDTIAAQVTYFEGHENYKVVLVNGKAAPARESIAGATPALGGAFSKGEFGSLLRDIFRPESQARFKEGHGTKLRDRRMSVLTYDIQRENSRYRLIADERSEYAPSYRGEIFVDDETKMVMRIVMSPYGMPKGFPIRIVTTTLDYDFVKIDGREYLLPVKAEIVSNHHAMWTRNVEEFRDYRKFGTDSHLTFDMPDAPPEKP